MSDKPCCGGNAARYVIWTLVIAMFFLHHDFWWWDDKTLVFGFMPIGLFYHTSYSIAAGLLWLAACRWAWPHHIEAWADEFDHDAPTRPGDHA